MDPPENVDADRLAPPVSSPHVRKRSFGSISVTSGVVEPGVPTPTGSRVPTPVPELLVPAADVSEEVAGLPGVLVSSSDPGFLGYLRSALGHCGAALLICVGYFDPGNWATDLAAGAAFRYELLSVILLSSFMAILLQSLSVKLGLVTGKDLAQHCASAFPLVPRILLWCLAEFAIIATDLAEVIGSAIALNLLFALPLPWGICVTSLDTLLLLIVWKKTTQRIFELGIAVLVVIVASCFVALLSFATPQWNEVFAGFLPTGSIFTNGDKLYIAIGIVGATIMPHSLFLHSHLVIRRTATSLSSSMTQIRKSGSTLCLLGTLRLYYFDTGGALSLSFCINSAILIVSAATFASNGIEISSIQDAFFYMKQKLGAGAAYTFAVALLLSGHSALIAGTMAGQVVANGFLGPESRLLRLLKPWIRRLLTRMLAIVPAMAAALIGGEQAINKLLVGSQVALSIQLPFCVWPLLFFTSSRNVMKTWLDASGKLKREWDLAVTVPPQNWTVDYTFVNSWPTIIIGSLVAAILSGLNVWLVVQLGLGKVG
ncbi:natural resistance-associated macrophage protein-domain-containing protein [Hyaloraphidium curvatum]|nr:natural resistance-associated macrophage protein-domain-containing protein [Hyaloraphidium curvatum]